MKAVGYSPGSVPSHLYRSYSNNIRIICTEKKRRDVNQTVFTIWANTMESRTLRNNTYI
jgi:hypothetical protein